MSSLNIDKDTAICDSKYPLQKIQLTIALNLFATNQYNMFSFKSNKQQKQQHQQPPTSPGDNTYTRQLHPTKYGRVQTIDSTKPFDEKVSDNLLLTSNEDGSLVESELSTTDQHHTLVAPATPAADIVDELDVLGNTTNDKLNKEDLLKLAAKEEEGAVSIKKEDLLDNISIFSVKDDSFSVTDGDESTDESAKSGSTRSSKSNSTKSSRSGKSKGSSVKSRLSIRSKQSSKSTTLQSVQESNVMSDKQANDAYNKLWHNNSNSSQKSGAAGEGGGSTAASQTSEKSSTSQKKKGSAADAQSLDNTFEEDGQSVYSSSYISVYSAAATERSCDGSFMSKKSVKSSKKEDVNAEEEVDTDAVEESPKEKEEKKEEVPAAKVVVDTHSALEKDNEKTSSEESKKKTPSLPLFNNKKNLKSKRFFGKLSNKKNTSSESDVEDSTPLPVHVNDMSDEEVEITYGAVSSLPIKEVSKSTKEDSMARTTSNTTAPTVESKEEEEEELEKVVPFTVSHSYYGAGAEDEDDGGFFGKLLSCTGVPQCNGGADGEFDNDMLADQVKQTTAVGEEGGKDDDEEEAYLNVEIFEDGKHTRIGYFMESTDEDDEQAKDTSDDRIINMRVRSKVILKTKVPQGSEEDVVDNIANKLQEEQQKDITTGNASLDNSLKSKKKNVLRMKLLKRLNKKETVTN